MSSFKDYLIGSVEGGFALIFMSIAAYPVIKVLYLLRDWMRS